MAIDNFSGEFEWLSNFSPSDVKYEGYSYRTVEHAYQAAKTLIPEERSKIQMQDKPADAKKLGRKVKMRSGWDDMKLGVMEQLLRQKFQDPKLKGLLLATGDVELVEGNWWGDTFWGVCKGVGKNHLGKLLMRIRSDLRASSA